jgi:hypothetical protein
MQSFDCKKRAKKTTSSDKEREKIHKERIDPLRRKGIHQKFKNKQNRERKWERERERERGGWGRWGKELPI